MLADPKLQLDNLAQVELMVHRGSTYVGERLTDLKPLLDLVRAGDACNELGVQKFEHYVFHHLDKKVWHRAEPGLQRVFLALAYQLSEACQARLAEQLQQAAQQAGLEEPQVVATFERFAGSLEHKTVAYSQIDFVKHQTSRQLSSDWMAVMKVRDLELAKEALKLCNTRVWPLAKDLVAPLVRLVHLGVDYQGERRRALRSSLSSSPLAQRWYWLTSVCESVRETNSVCQRDSATASLPKVSFESQSSRLKFIQKSQCIDKISGQYSSSRFFKPAYQLPQAHLGDQIWLRGAELDALVHSFGTFSSSKLGQLRRWHQRA